MKRTKFLYAIALLVLLVFLVTFFLSAMILQFFPATEAAFTFVVVCLLLSFQLLLEAALRCSQTHVSCGSTFFLLFLLFVSHLAFAFFLFCYVLLLLLLIANIKYSQIPTCAIGRYRNAFNGFLPPPPSTFFVFFNNTRPGEGGRTSTLRYEVTQSCVYIHGHETIDSINDHQSTTWTSTNKQTEAYTYAYIMHEFLCVYVCLQACVCL